MNELQERTYIEDDEIDLFEIIDILVKRKFFIIISFVLFTIIGLGGALYYRSVKPFILAKKFSIDYSYAEKDYFFNKSKIVLNKINPNNILLNDKYINKLFSIKELEEMYKETSPKDDYSKVKFLQEIIKINFDEKLNSYTLEVEMKRNELLQKEIINTYLLILKDEIENDIVKNIDEKYSTIKSENEKSKNELAKIEKQIENILITHSNMISDKTDLGELIKFINPTLVIEKNKITDIYTNTSNLLVGFDTLKDENNFNLILNNIIKEKSSIYAVDSSSKAKFILLGVSIFGIVFGIMGAFVLEFIETYKKRKIQYN
ncbi:hypothetical protein I6E31_07795 [Fusobacterium varium]|nr:hypothetical protein [Fusobacterium varium]